jgi:hypothetical protein
MISYTLFMDYQKNDLSGKIGDSLLHSYGNILPGAIISNNIIMNQQLKSVLVRFIKGALSGGATAIALVTYNVPTSWSSFPHVLNTLGIAFVGGALSGILLALEKWASWTDTPPTV